jgi:hypothetical protein
MAKRANSPESGENHLFALRRAADGKVWSGLYFRHVAIVLVLRENIKLNGWEIYRLGWKSWKPLAQASQSFEETKKRLIVDPIGVPKIPQPRKDR